MRPNRAFGGPAALLIAVALTGCAGGRSWMQADARSPLMVCGRLSGRGRGRDDFPMRRQRRSGARKDSWADANLNELRRQREQVKVLAGKQRWRKPGAI